MELGPEDVSPLERCPHSLPMSSGGLLDSSLELVKALHSQLVCTESLQKPSITPRKKVCLHLAIFG